MLFGFKACSFCFDFFVLEFCFYLLPAGHDDGGVSPDWPEAGQHDGGVSAWFSSFAGHEVRTLPSTSTAGNFSIFSSFARAAFSGFEMSRIVRLPWVDSEARWLSRLIVSLQDEHVFVKTSIFVWFAILASLGLGLIDIGYYTGIFGWLLSLILVIVMGENGG